jgi:hypothetical protein
MPSSAVEGEQELGAQVLTERMLRDEYFELGQSSPARARERSVGTTLERGEAELRSRRPRETASSMGSSATVDPTGKRSSKSSAARAGSFSGITEAV